MPGLVITPVGVLFGFIACTILATSGVADHEQGLASGLLSTSQQIGQALGLAVVLNVVAWAEARRRWPGPRRDRRAGGRVPRRLRRRGGIRGRWRWSCRSR